MARLFLALALAITVSSQPLETVTTSGGATLTTLLLNWAQVGLEAFVEFVRRSFREENTTSGTKILVATGLDSGGNTEIIDVEDASFNCTVNRFPKYVWGATGGLVGDTPLICGGMNRDRQKSCYSLKEDGTWKLESNLNTARNAAANGEVIMNNKLVIAGGSKGNYLATIEVVAPNTRPRTLPIRLPVVMSGSCIVPWDTNTFMIIGGKSGRYTTSLWSLTYFINIYQRT